MARKVGGEVRVGVEDQPGPGPFAQVKGGLGQPGVAGRGQPVGTQLDEPHPMPEGRRRGV